MNTEERSAAWPQPIPKGTYALTHFRESKGNVGNSENRVWEGVRDGGKGGGLSRKTFRTSS